MEEIITSPNKITAVSPQPEVQRGVTRQDGQILNHIQNYNIINGLWPIMPKWLMILFSHLCEDSGVWHDDLILARWSLRFLDVKLVLTLPMYFNIWLRLVKVWSSQMCISTWRYYWWYMCHLLMSAWCAASRKESSSKYPMKNII